MPASAEFSRDGAVATVTLLPDGPVTSLSRGLVDSLNAALDQVEAAPELHCLVISGSGRTFIVGADVKEMNAHSLDENLAYNQDLIDLNRRIAELDVPVVACLNGHAFGGGLELALACSIRVGAQDALFGLPEVKLGILPGAGGVVRLPRTVGPGAAMTMMLTGRSVPAAEALRIGLVDELAPSAEVLAHAQALAHEIAGHGPLALRAIKAAARAAEGLPVDGAIQDVHRTLAGLLESADASEGIAAFVDKRSPQFTAS